MEPIKFKMQWLYYDIAKLKEAQVTKVKNIISCCRLNHQIVFSGYGNITFDEPGDRHETATLEFMDEYSRSKTNCLVYDLLYDYNNFGYFDKIFIFISQLKECYYSYIMYNSKTGYLVHKTLIELIEDQLINSIYKDLFTMGKRNIYNFYRRKYDAVKAFHTDKSVHIPSEAEYQKVIKENKERQKIDIFNYNEYINDNQETSENKQIIVA